MQQTARARKPTSHNNNNNNQLEQSPHSARHIPQPYQIQNYHLYMPARQFSRPPPPLGCGRVASQEQAKDEARETEHQPPGPHSSINSCAVL